MTKDRPLLAIGVVRGESGAPRQPAAQRKEKSMSIPPVSKPRYYDSSDPEGDGLDPARAAPRLLDRLAEAVRVAPNWEVNGRGIKARLAVEAHEPGKSLRVACEAGDAKTTITLRLDESGWLHIAAVQDGAELLSAYVDRPFEEIALWADGALAEGPSPGLIGRGLNWVSLEAGAWPVLVALADAEGRVKLSTPDA
jgi:hypothetical protein